MALPQTPGQTVGPFFRFGVEFDKSEQLVDRGYAGAIQLHGTVYDGEGSPVPDAIVEIWQRDERGEISREEGTLKRTGWNFTGFGRSLTDDSGHYTFTTVNPGGGGFIAVVVFARGLMDRLHTRIYLPETPDDSTLEALGDRASTLVATREANGNLLHDIRLQGDGETVFFDFD